MANSISVAVGDIDTIRTGGAADELDPALPDFLSLPQPARTSSTMSTAVILRWTRGTWFLLSVEGWTLDARGALPCEPRPFLEAGSSRPPAGDLAHLPTRRRTTVAGQRRIRTGLRCRTADAGKVRRPRGSVNPRRRVSGRYVDRHAPRRDPAADRDRSRPGARGALRAHRRGLR